MLHRRKGSHGAGTWSVLGGHLEFGESFEDTARREVMEEVGLEITNVRFGAITNDIFPEDGKRYVTVWMLSDYAGGQEKIMEPEKCDGLVWCTFDDLPHPLTQWWDTLFASEFIEAIKNETVR